MDFARSVSTAKAPWTELNANVNSWAVIRTAARWEKKLADSLTSIGVSAYLPIVTRISKYKSRTNRAEVPLFVGYIFFDFAKIADLNRDAPGLKGIAQILCSPDPATLKEELAAISTLLSNAQLVQTKIFGGLGNAVRVRSGLFKDAEGKIVRQLANKRRLVISVSFLGLTTEVELDDKAIEKL